MYVSVNWVSIGSGNGLSPVWQEAITWTKAGLLSSEPLRINFSEIGIELQNFSFMKMHFKMSSVEWQPFRLLGRDELKCLAYYKVGFTVNSLI